jgi:hypothetical protein
MKDITDAAAVVLADLQSREPIFHRPEFGTTRAEFEAMTVPDYWEVGASGKAYSREFVLDELERRHAEGTWREDPFETLEFQCRQLAEEVFLLTYVLIQALPQGKRRSRRTTIWQRSERGWVALFHQGTLAPDA